MASTIVGSKASREAFTLLSIPGASILAVDEVLAPAFSLLLNQTLTCSIRALVHPAIGKTHQRRFNKERFHRCTLLQ